MSTLLYTLGALLMFSYVNLLQVHFRLPVLYRYAPVELMRQYPATTYWLTILLWPVAVLIMIGCTLFGWTPQEFYQKSDAKDDADGAA